MKKIFIIASKMAWAEAQIKGDYRSPSLQDEGFIHCSLIHQVLGVAERRFRGHQDLILLSIDESMVSAPIKYEGREGNAFPHIYGPLNLSAVVEVLPFSEGSEGFQLPEALRPR